MTQVAQALYLVSTAAFAAIALVVSTRLIRLSSRTGLMAERWLGLGILGTAVLGYATMMAGLIGRQAAEKAGEPLAIWIAITVLGWLFHNAGVMCMLRFVVSVFHPEERWARAVGIAMTGVLWAGWLAFAMQGGMRDGVLRGSYWITFSVIGTYPLWMAVESFRYYLRMRRRLALGLADPLVTDRFRLWGLASTCAAASIWIVSLPGLMGASPGSPRANELTAVCMLFTGAFGIATVSIYWLTFFPPRWYRQRFETPSAATP